MTSTRLKQMSRTVRHWVIVQHHCDIKATGHFKTQFHLYYITCKVYAAQFCCRLLSLSLPFIKRQRTRSSQFFIEQKLIMNYHENKSVMRMHKCPSVNLHKELSCRVICLAQGGIMYRLVGTGVHSSFHFFISLAGKTANDMALWGWETNQESSGSLISCILQLMRRSIKMNHHTYRPGGWLVN